MKIFFIQAQVECLKWTGQDKLSWFFRRLEHTHCYQVVSCRFVDVVAQAIHRFVDMRGLVFSETLPFSQLIFWGFVIRKEISLIGTIHVGVIKFLR